jgi:hypothetical protein
MAMLDLGLVSRLVRLESSAVEELALHVSKQVEPLINRGEPLCLSGKVIDGKINENEKIPGLLPIPRATF